MQNRRYSTTFPRLEEKLPIADNPDAEIGIMYYVYGDIDIYLEEALYAYRQLCRHTNILDVGRVHFFVEGSPRSMGCIARFGGLGISDLVSYIPIGGKTVDGRTHTGYIPCFRHRALRGCRYAVLLDSDMWLASDGYPPLDWWDFISVWDAQPERTVFGESIRISREDILKQLGIRSLYEAFISPSFPDDRRAVSGYFVGLREDEGRAELIGAYEDAGQPYSDESFLQAFLHTYKDWSVYHTLGHEVPFANFSNYKDFESTFFINVGMHEFHGEHYQRNKKDLRSLL